jgi:hypothetical protein
LLLTPITSFATFQCIHASIFWATDEADVSPSGEFGDDDDHLFKQRMKLMFLHPCSFYNARNRFPEIPVVIQFLLWDNFQTFVNFL